MDSACLSYKPSFYSWAARSLLLGLLWLASCQLPPNPTSDLLPPPGAGTEPLPAWGQVYFSNPDSPIAGDLRGGPDRVLADAIRAARLSVAVAAYDLNLWSVRDALLESHRRGVDVRLVTDSDNLERAEIQDLMDAGIPVLGDRREGLMHNKFVVIDGQDVWTGSLNLTLNSAYRNNDNLIHIHSPELGENYTTEFSEMFEQDRFGPGSPANTPNPAFQIAGSRIETYFAPDDGVQAHILRLISSAKKDLKIMAYSLTADEIADALLGLAQAGLPVSGVLDAGQAASNRGADYERLRAAGLDLRLDGNPKNMHHKVIIIDDQVVITGSYNFSASAETKNDENLLVIYDPRIAAAYLQEFHKVYSQAQP